MKKMILLFLICLSPTLFKSETQVFRRVKDDVSFWQILQEKLRGITSYQKRVITPYFYRDELSYLAKWFTQGKIEENQLGLLLGIASACNFSYEDVYNSLTGETAFKSLLENIVQRAVLNLISEVKRGNMRFLEVTSDIPFPMETYLEQQYYQSLESYSTSDSLSKRKAILEIALARGEGEGDGLEGICNFLWQIVISGNPGVTLDEKKIALKGISKFGSFKNFLQLLKFYNDFDSKLKGDLDIAINKLAERYLTNSRIRNFSGLIKATSRNPAIVRLSDGSFLEIDEVKILIPLPGKWELAMMKSTDGEVWACSWGQFKEALAVPVIWNQVAEYIKTVRTPERTK